MPPLYAQLMAQAHVVQAEKGLLKILISVTQGKLLVGGQKQKLFKNNLHEAPVARP